MAVIGSLILRMGADAKPLNKALDSADAKIGRFASRNSGGGGGGIGGGLAVGAGLGLATAGIGAAVAAGAGLLGFFTHAIQSASDLNETLSLTGVVLEGAAGPVIAYADKMASTFGLAKKEVLDAATGFAGLGAGLGKLQGDELSDFSIQFTQLAADLQSAKNTSTLAEAAQALTIALSGEQSDLLKQMGVVVNETTVKEYALANGIARAGEKLTEQQKLMGRSGILMQGLGKISGDLARTAGDPAAQFRKAGGGVENFAIAVGKILLPAVQAATNIFNNFMAAVLTGFEYISGPIRAIVAGITAVFNDTFIPGLVNIGTAIATYLGSIPAAFTSIFGTGTTGMLMGFATAIKTFVLDKIELMGFFWRNLPDIVTIAFLQITQQVLNLGAYFTAFATNVGLIGGWFIDNFVNILIDGMNRVVAVVQNLGTNFQSLWAGIQSFMAGKGFTFEWTPLLQGFEATVGAMPAMVDPVFVNLQSQIDEKIAAIGTREADRAAALAKAAGAPVIGMAAGAPAATGVGETAAAAAAAGKYAGTAALELGSAAAGSAIAKHRFGGAGDDKPLKDVAKTSKESLTEQRKQTTTLAAILEKTGTSLASYTI